MRGAQRITAFLPARTTTASTSAIRRPLSTSQVLRGGSGSHESRFDPPTGWLFGVKPGEKPEREGWEWIWYIGIYGTLALTTVLYVFKPDTSIQTWALEEARRRLEAEGILEDPFPNHKLVDTRPHKE
ncbi:hypothetical protein GQ43DRAFT_374695 [Delitschia confertaspora ATCC 74209]|uniref:NADH dehydrogenase [ubiquinone] 1 beta subcomplex subunit 11, mitochondrial n=1 Tax=Delitschia confertaspora ATCC 74209 TaxID=1513339 RepID=A0A9P4MR60_9PLEO|nr:hypothetical protein GQ43DRAFT_374695 [Delitschia confertaspora ATCC 74209]